MKKTLVVIVIILLCVVIIELIGFTKQTSNLKYRVLENKSKLEFLFIDSLRNIVVPSYAFGNDVESIILYDLDSSQQILIWEIPRFINVDPSSITANKNLRFNKIFIDSEFYFKWGMPKTELGIKLEDLSCNELFVHVTKDTELLNSEKSEEMLFIDLLTDGIALSDSINYKFKLEFEPRTRVNTLFYRRSNSMFVIVLIDKTKGMSSKEINLLEIMDLTTR